MFISGLTLLSELKSANMVLTNVYVLLVIATFHLRLRFLEILAFLSVAQLFIYGTDASKIYLNLLD